MNTLKNISLPNRVIISLGILASVTAYLLVSNNDIIYALYAGIILAALNLILIMKRIVLAVIILVLQSVFTLAFVYSMETVLNPQTSLAYSSISLIFIVLTSIVIYYTALGRYWVNLTLFFITFNIMLLGYYANISEDTKLLYLASAVLLPAIIIFVKNKIIARKIISPAVYPSSNLNSLNSVKITNYFKKNNIEYTPLEGFPARLINAGDRFFITYEPESTAKSKITPDGLFIGENNYTAFLEKLIIEAKQVAKLKNMKPKNITPIIILQDFNNSKVSKIKVYSSFKPDIKIGEVIVCSPEGVASIVNAINRPVTK